MESAKRTNLLTMSREAIFKRIDSDGMHRQFMGRTENADRNFLGVDRVKFDHFEKGAGAYSSICNEDLGQWTGMTSSFSSHSLYRVHGGAWCTR